MPVNNRTLSLSYIENGCKKSRSINIEEMDSEKKILEQLKVVRFHGHLNQGLMGRILEYCKSAEEIDFSAWKPLTIDINKLIAKLSPNLTALTLSNGNVISSSKLKTPISTERRKFTLSLRTCSKEALKTVSTAFPNLVEFHFSDESCLQMEKEIIFPSLRAASRWKQFLLSVITCSSKSVLSQQYGAQFDLETFAVTFKQAEILHLHHVKLESLRRIGTESARNLKHLHIAIFDYSPESLSALSKYVSLEYIKVCEVKSSSRTDMPIRELTSQLVEQLSTMPKHITHEIGRKSAISGDSNQGLSKPDDATDESESRFMAW